MNRSDAIDKLAEALAAAQSMIENAAKDSVNPHFRSRYADLASVWDACREPLATHGLAVIQTTSQGKRLNADTPPGIILETMLAHTSGQWISGVIPVYCDTRNPQAIGSALTYARRYGLAAMVGVCPSDDDGEAAVAPQREQADRRRNGPPPERADNRTAPRRDAKARSDSRPTESLSATAQIKRFEEDVKRFCDRMNAGWVEKREAAGEAKGTTKELINVFQLVGHMLKVAGISFPDGGKYNDRMKAAAKLWTDDESGVKSGWKEYVAKLANEFPAQTSKSSQNDTSSVDTLATTEARSRG